MRSVWKIMARGFRNHIWTHSTTNIHIPQQIVTFRKQWTHWTSKRQSAGQQCGGIQKSLLDTFSKQYTHSTINNHISQTMDTLNKQPPEHKPPMRRDSKIMPGHVPGAISTFHTQWTHSTSNRQSTSHQWGGIQKSCVDTFQKQYTHSTSNGHIPQANSGAQATNGGEGEGRGRGMKNQTLRPLHVIDPST